ERRDALWSGLLCGKSVRAARRLHAQRFCGATSVRADAAGGADGAAALRDGGEPPSFSAAHDGVFCAGVCGGVALECAGRSDGELQRSATFFVGGVREKIVATLAVRRRGIGAGFWIDELLPIAGGL